MELQPQPQEADGKKNVCVHEARPHRKKILWPFNYLISEEEEEKGADQSE